MTGFLLIAMAVLAQALPARAAGELRLGVQDNLGYEHTVKAWAPTAEYLSKKLGRTVSLVPLSTLESDYALKDGAVDLLLAGPITQEILHENNQVDFLLTPERELGGARVRGTGATLFYPPGAIGGARDLRGRRVAASFERSIAVLALRAAMRKEGLKKNMPELYFTGDSAAALREVRTGGADAALIPTVAFYSLLENGSIKPGEFEVLRFTEAPPEPAFGSTRIYQGLILSAMADSDPDLAHNIVEALIEMPPGHAAAKAGFYLRWGPAYHNHELQAIMRQEGLIEGPRRSFPAAVFPAAAAALLIGLISPLLLWRRTRYCQPLLSGIKDPAVVVDRSCRILYANPAAHEKLGMKAGALSGMKCHKVLSGKDGPPEECSALLAGGCGSCSHAVRDLDGNGMTAETHCLTGGRLLCITRPAGAEAGRQTRLYHEAQIEAMSSLSAAVAHQFNNLLSVISAGLHIIRSGGSGESDRAAALSSIDNAVHSGAAINRQLQTLSQANRIKRVQLDLRAITGDILKVFSSRPEAPDVELRFPEGLPAIEADPLELSRLLQYLLGCGEFSAAEGEPVTLEASSVALARPGGQEDSDFVKLTISRLCAGFDRAAVRTIFQPGLDTSRWGLALAYAIAKKHGGWVDASYSWKGVLSFEIYLPAAAAAQREADSPPPADFTSPAAAPAASRKLRILLAEDDADLRDVTTRVLGMAGHSVTAAGDGKEAERLISSGGFDALLTDVIMPGMSGEELATAATARYPGLRVVLMSGHTEGRIDTEKAGRKGWAFIQKPYDPEKLLKLLEQGHGG